MARPGGYGGGRVARGGIWRFARGAVNRMYFYRALGGLGVYGLVVYWVDPFLVWIFAGLALLGFAGLVVLGVIVALLQFGRGNGLERVPLRSLGRALVCTALAGSMGPVSGYVQEREVVAAKAYAARVTPLLEAYRQTHGRYPESLSELPGRLERPMLLRDSDCYWSDGKRYRFTFAQPGGLIDTWNYDSTEGKWQLST